jgi:hypothetical protein
MKQTLAEIAKAITTALTTFAFLYTKDKPGGVTSDEWVEIAVYTVIAFVAVWLVPNADPPTTVRLGPSTTAGGGANGTEAGSTGS